MIRIAINGFGRIGRGVFKTVEETPELEVVAVNDLADENILKHLLKYDSLYGKYNKNITSQFFAEKEPEKLPWRKLGIDVVLECTGKMRTHDLASGHLRAGAKRVIISASPKSDDIPVFLLAVNEKDYTGERIISMGSCTTNCLAPIAKIIDDNFVIEKGFLTTTHSYTNDQVLLDNIHQDKRRARSAGSNIIPTTTGATETVAKALPRLKGKLNGLALRVPTAVVSIVDFVCLINKPASKEEINKILEENTSEILKVEKEPLVSSDYRGSPYSCIIDASLTQSFGNLIKVLAWYDNEYAYCKRLAEMASYISKR